MRKKLGGTARRRHEPPEYSFIISQWLLPNNKHKKSLLCFYEWGAPYITLLIAGVYGEKLSLSGCDKIIKGLQLDLLPQVPRY